MSWRTGDAPNRSTRLVCAGVNITTTVLQMVFYSNNQTVLLAVMHVRSGPIFAAMMALTIAAAARRQTATERETIPSVPLQGTIMKVGHRVYSDTAAPSNAQAVQRQTSRLPARQLLDENEIRQLEGLTLDKKCQYNLVVVVRWECVKSPRLANR